MRTPHKIKYSIHKKNGVVVATMSDCEADAVNKFGANVQTVMIPRINPKDNRFIMPHKFVGVARCSKNDEFDEKTGMKIAKQRLMQKYVASLNRHTSNLVEYYTQYLDNLNLSVEISISEDCF